MTHKPINTILYCNKFTFKDPSNSDGAHPLQGRVYDAHYDSEKDQYIIAVPTSGTRTIAFIFSGDEGNNPVWEYEFTEVTSKSVDKLHLHEDDSDVIEQFSERKGKDILTGNDGLVDNHDAVSFSDEDEDDEDDDEGEDEDREPTAEEIKETEKFIKETMDLMKNETTRIERAVNAMNSILRKDPTMAIVLQEYMIYLASTYDEKYAKSPIPTNGVIYSKDHGTGFNIGNASKYLSRYMTKGFDKSENPRDLDKAIHYCMFELARRAKQS
jgi:hypothetical protein